MQKIELDFELPPTYAELDDVQVKVIRDVYDLKPVKEIKEELGVGKVTVYNILNGLCGEKKEIPKKWQTEKKYLKRLPDHTNLAIKYELDTHGKKLISDSDIPTKNRNGEDEFQDGRRVVNHQSSDTEWLIRPHYLTAKLTIKRSPDKWGRQSYFADREDEFSERIIKEMPDDGVVEGRKIYYQGWEVELYENTVVVRVEYGAEELSPKRFWKRYRDCMREVVRYVEKRFPVKLRSSPENIEASISTQHWAKLQDAFAEMVVNNKEKWGDDEDGVLWMVRNGRDEPVALVDVSDEVELEWVHSQEAKNHMDNVKDLLLWGSYYEITPNDFRNVAWLREHVDMFEEICEQVQELDGIRKRIDAVAGRLDDVESDVTRNRDAVKGLAAGMYSEFQEQGERIDRTQDEVGMLRSDVMAQAQMIGETQRQLQSHDEYHKTVTRLLKKHQSRMKNNKEAVERQGRLIGYMAEIMERHEREFQNHDERMEQQLQVIQEVHEKTLEYKAVTLLETVATGVRKCAEKVRDAAAKTVDKVRGLL